MSISAVMIMKDEEKFIKDCLDSMQGIVDEVILVDTGSKDNSVRIAKQYNFVKLDYFEWCKDFSKARNVALKQATKDWCLWIDADERIPEKSKKELLEKTSEKPDQPTAYQVTVENTHNDGRLSTVNNFRLWSNHKKVRFTGKVHEQIIPAFNSIEGSILKQSNIILHHVGYASNPDELQKKRDRNQELMEDILKEEPDNYYIHYTMAQNCMLNNNQEEALKHLKIVNDASPFSNQFMAAVKNSIGGTHLNLGNMEQAYYFALQSIILEPRQVVAFQIISQYYFYNNLFFEAKKTVNHIAEIQKLLKDKGKFLIHDNIVTDEWFHNALTKIHSALNEFKPGDIIVRANGNLIGIHNDLEMQQLPNVEIN